MKNNVFPEFSEEKIKLINEYYRSELYNNLDNSASDLNKQLIEQMENNINSVVGSDSLSNWNFRKPTQYIRENPKIGRNDKCPCGSGKKYKNCCGK